MSKRRERKRIEGTFLEHASSRLMMLEKLVSDVHWSDGYDGWQYDSAQDDQGVSPSTWNVVPSASRCEPVLQAPQSPFGLHD